MQATQDGLLNLSTYPHNTKQDKGKYKEVDLGNILAHAVQINAKKILLSIYILKCDYFR